MLEQSAATQSTPNFTAEPKPLPITAWPGIPSINDAFNLSRSLLAVRRPRVWAYTQTVAEFAHGLGYRMHLSPSEHELLTSAAWLHSIGVAMCANPSPAAWATLSGALHLRVLKLDPVANLVAWNAASAEEANLLGLDALLSEFPQPTGRVADALTFATLHVSPVRAERCTLQQRLVDTRAQRGADSTPAQALMNAWTRVQAIDTRMSTVQ